MSDLLIGACCIHPTIYSSYHGKRERSAYFCHQVRRARISEAFPLRAGQESVKYEPAQFLSGYSVLKHMEVDKDEQTRRLPAIGTQSRNKLEKCGLDFNLARIFHQTS